MKFRTGAAAGTALGTAAGAGGVVAALSARRLGRRVLHRAERRLERETRGLVAKAEQAGPLGRAALAGITALRDGKSPFRALLSFGWTALKETLARIFGRGRRGRPTNIVEQIDVGAPRRLVYDQWTRFQDYPSFMKKVVSVDQASDAKLNWKAKIFWSSRTWESTIGEQVPDEHIVWRSKGPKGHVDGAVSFHELTPDLTRVLLVLEYHPAGLFERTGNLWRAQGRRARLELKHFRRHVMTQALTRPDEVEGWRGEIRGGEIVTTPK
ncbi:SRPBCC family protein [Actinomadura bangladeshensis]|uniref:SRPBCC family protein n=1 Tax=Actinomadura bangladeshensis TaxID=453573 RepID=A0A4R4P0K3_9ACTN|nr:SRPBCC family protein [Actinomadura bangladeshensis]TDC15359.1 SRPBCC family protein [Actinomadura bangladeshensis]